VLSEYDAEPSTCSCLSSRDRLFVVGQRQADLDEPRRQRARIAANRMGVIELIVADAHLDGRKALSVFIAAIDSAKRRENLRAARVVERICGVIGGHGLLFQDADVARQLRLQNGEEGGPRLRGHRRYR
jgi:hypothetical protein